ISPHVSLDLWEMRMDMKGYGHLALVMSLTLAATSAQADLRFVRPSAHVGEVRTGRPLTHRFAFVNTGPEAVEITDTRASCGCLAPRLAKRLYQPGEEGELLMEINTLSKPAGQNPWHVKVGSCRGDTAGEASLQLTAQVVAEVAVQPAAVTVFAGNAVGHEILLTD